MQAILHHHTRRNRYTLSRSSNFFDMSAFVDLGIILLCSLAFLQLIHREKAVEIIAPEIPDPYRFGCIDDGVSLLSFVLTDTKVVYFHGIANYDTMSFPISEPYHIPTIISQFRKRYASYRKFIVILYPTSKTSFKNLMDVIDELNQVPNIRYTLDFSTAGDHILSYFALFGTH